MLFVLYHATKGKYLFTHTPYREWCYVDNVSSATIFEENKEFRITPEHIMQDVENDILGVGGEKVLKSELQAHEVKVQFVRML